MIVLIPPAFGVFGGVHVHFQQLAIAFPAVLYVFARYPQVRTLAASGLGLAMIPWNVMSASLLAGLSPLLAGIFGVADDRAARGAGVRRCRGADRALAARARARGARPAAGAFVPHAYPPGALAEATWGDFSRSTLMRPSLMMQWLRVRRCSASPAASPRSCASRTAMRCAAAARSGARRPFR